MITPREIITDTDKPAVIYTPGLAQALPGLPAAFARMDTTYEADKLAYVRRMRQGELQVEQENAMVRGSIICDEETAKSPYRLIIFSAFADNKPITSSKRMHTYVESSRTDVITRELAQPNSWNQATKSLTIHDLLKEMGIGMPVITIYSPIPPKAYSASERTDIRKGVLSPAARTAENMLAASEQYLYQQFGIPLGQELNVFFRGESLGDNALGSASVLRKKDDKHQVMGVIAQELIMGPEHLVDLAARFTIQQYVGELSRLILPGCIEIPEPQFVQDILKNGKDFSTYLRVVLGMTKLTHLLGLTKPHWLAEQTEYLVDHGVPVFVGNAQNSSMSYETWSYLPVGHPLLHYIVLKGLENQRVGHISDDHVALGACLTALGIRKAQAMM